MNNTWLDKLRTLLTPSASRDLLDRPNLRREVVEGILALKQRGRHGSEVLPPAVAITITVGEASAEVVRGFVADPTFLEEVEANLLNRLVGAQSESLPRQIYAVLSGPSIGVQVQPAQAGAVLYWLRICGGDKDGTIIPLDATRAAFQMGRESTTETANDIVLSESARFISRRAARLLRQGAGLSIEALDQGEFLIVERTDKSRIRPVNTRSRRVPVQPQDRLLFTDGEKQQIMVEILDQEPT